MTAESPPPAFRNPRPRNRTSGLPLFDRAIQRTWQRDYELPLLPDRSAAEDSAIEKLVDRLGMATADFPTQTTAATHRADLLGQLTPHGVTSTGS